MTSRGSIKLGITGKVRERLTKPDCAWFKLEDYAAMQDFGRRAWASMLNWRQKWYDTFPPADLDIAAYWDDYLKDVLPRNYKSDNTQQYCPNVRPLEDRTSEFLRAPDKFGASVAIGQVFRNLRVLVVDLGFPDSELKNKFSAWLKEQRKHSPLPIKRRGRKATNVEVTDEHLVTWKNYNILGVLDLDLYAKLQGVEQLPHEALADLLKPPEAEDQSPEGFNAKEWGRAARSKAKEALQAVDLIEASLTSGR